MGHKRPRVARAAADAVAVSNAVVNAVIVDHGDSTETAAQSAQGPVRQHGKQQLPNALSYYQSWGDATSCYSASFAAYRTSQSARPTGSYSASFNAYMGARQTETIRGSVRGQGQAEKFSGQ